MCFLALKMSLGFCVNRLVPQDKNACLGKQPTKSRQKDIQFLLRLCQDCLNPRPPPHGFLDIYQKLFVKPYFKATRVPQNFGFWSSPAPFPWKCPNHGEGPQLWLLALLWLWLGVLLVLVLQSTQIKRCSSLLNARISLVNTNQTWNLSKCLNRRGF